MAVFMKMGMSTFAILYHVTNRASGTVLQLDLLFHKIVILEDYVNIMRM